MGQINDQDNFLSVCEDKLSKNKFEYINVIGKGGYGKVWKVYCKNDNKFYALKEMLKAKIIDQRSESNIMFERDLLTKMDHPFIVQMHASFQDLDSLYILMEILSGGDLRYHLYHKKKFTEEQTKFFLCCTILGLDYIHYNNVIHRDIKPENLLFDDKGYLKISDFGIAKYLTKGESSDSSGTPGYMSPEVLCFQNHTTAVDYFSLGIIAYECMFGTRPYIGKNRKEIKEKILTTQVQIKKSQIPRGWSMESADFINRLLERKQSKRLGYCRRDEIKIHSWVKFFPWKDLYLHKLTSPFIPESNKENFDHKFCNKFEPVGPNTQERYLSIISKSNFSKVFNGYKNFYRFKEESNPDRNSEYFKNKFKNPHLIYLKNNDVTTISDFADGGGKRSSMVKIKSSSYIVGSSGGNKSAFIGYKNIVNNNLNNNSNNKINNDVNNNNIKEENFDDDSQLFSRKIGTYKNKNDQIFRQMKVNISAFNMYNQQSKNLSSMNTYKTNLVNRNDLTFNKSYRHKKGGFM